MITLKENYNRFFGSTVSNPFEGENANKQINIVQGVFVPNDPPGVYIVENMAHYKGALLSVHFHTEEWSIVMGSAVIIAPGIAFTAAHVLEGEMMARVVAGDVHIECIGYTPSGPRFWEVSEWTSSPRPLERRVSFCTGCGVSACVPLDEPRKSFMKFCVTDAIRPGSKLSEAARALGLKVTSQLTL